MSQSVSGARACERSSVGHFIVIFFLAMRFYSTISLFHDMPTIFQLSDTMFFEFNIDIKQAPGTSSSLNNGNAFQFSE